jgi:hypothetical protein
MTDILAPLGLDLIPEPQEIRAGAGSFRAKGEVVVALPAGSPPEDAFAAETLADALREDFGIKASVADKGAIRIARGKGLKPEGYQLEIGEREVVIEGADAAGVFYGVQTLKQCLRKADGGVSAPALSITDWPSLKYRAIHYDTKHHQDKKKYVESFIRDLSSYKVNVLVWEWEDKLAYRKHPEIGAPGAFTIGEMQAFTRYAKSRHIQIVPLVQGLGHSSYILKHPQHQHLREIPDSNWEFCPLGDGTYDLLGDLYDEAIEATPGSEFLHVGSDETYELGEGVACGCKAKMEAIGKDALMQVFVKRVVAHGEKRGRKVMSWGGGWRPTKKQDGLPPKSMLNVQSAETENLKQAQDAGYKSFVYAPNPSITPLFLGYFPWVYNTMWKNHALRDRAGTFQETSGPLKLAGKTQIAEGSITTSWDDSGLHNQCWMPRFICAADASWKADGPDMDTWARRYFRNYFGAESRDVQELFRILQESAEFYYDTFQRKVWHWGDIGKFTLPDVPRGDMEFNDFYRGRYGQGIQRAVADRNAMRRALSIIDDNLSRPVRHRRDFEIFRSIAQLCRHNDELIIMLGEFEANVHKAEGLHYSDRPRALEYLKQCEKMLADSLADRDKVYKDLVTVWERDRLPKGLSLPGKPFVFARDRARHFAIRTPDMSYLIVDEQLLDVEGHLEKLRKFIREYPVGAAKAKG